MENQGTVTGSRKEIIEFIMRHKPGGTEPNKHFIELLFEGSVSDDQDDELRSKHTESELIEILKCPQRLNSLIEANFRSTQQSPIMNKPL